MKEAKYYTKLEKDNKVRCSLCPHNCQIDEGEAGICRTRRNLAGILYNENYSQTVTISLDPIEKKPLYHFYPGQNIMSVGPNSCNFKCDFCQNYTISQMELPTQELTPEMLLEVTRKHNCGMVAYTYTEPITWFEYVIDSAKLLHKNGIKTVFVTNGFINKEPLKELIPVIDAMNIDLKSMDDDFYRRLCKGRLQPVLETIETVSGNCELEITNLLITGENDTESMIKKLVDFLAEIDPNIPLHFSKYYPQYKMTNPPTPDSTLYKAKRIADKKLNYVYLGNIIADRDTYCPECGKRIVERGFNTRIEIVNGKCPDCQKEIYGEF